MDDVLETIDGADRNSKGRKGNWTVKEKAANKTLTTIFGGVRYARTYYKNKRTGNIATCRMKQYCICADGDGDLYVYNMEYTT